MDAHEFYSHGKLLLTGEYVVLDGAKALALPCKLGQSLSVQQSVNDKYFWTSYLRNGELWQKVSFSLEDVLKDKSETGFDKRLFQILKVVYKLNPGAFEKVYDFSTTLEFEKDWGLGSSSTLINNIAQWANLDPYELLEKTFGGSGYDIAAAKMQSPFIYRRTDDKVHTETVNLSDAITPHLFFIYLNQKQNSRQAIANYPRVNSNAKKVSLKQINQITQNIIKTDKLNEFESLLKSHETLISELIGLDTIKKQKFADYDSGIIKSLGAWGGDFILVTAKGKSELEYFRLKGYDTIFPFRDLVF
jgi:mevalonate kinase